jgi:uncharacterized protein (TIGR00661 family)
MKIFYAIQATGNGHISRAMELLPWLQQHGSVDIFLSGDNSHLHLDAPVKYRSRGISLYYNCKGGLDYWQILKGFHPIRLREEIRDLPVEKYDLVLNDFDHITSAACARKKIPSVHFGHQASFQSELAPRPVSKNRAGEWLLKHYVRASNVLGLHFDTYDDFICGAVIKKQVLEAEPVNKNHITVYLPSYCEPQLKQLFHSLADHEFEIFSKEISSARRDGNICFKPIDRYLFTQSLIQCKAIICGAGFETPAEALHLGKKLMVIPIRGQYEQQCNAAALQQLGITSISRVDNDFENQFANWIQHAPTVKKDYSRSIPDSMDRLFTLASSTKREVLTNEHSHSC